MLMNVLLKDDISKLYVGFEEDYERYIKIKKT